MKRRVRIGGAMTLLIVLFSWAAPAQLSRAAMVTQLSGGGLLGGKPIRTLQVFAEGCELSLPPGSNLRLVYLQSGQKEAVTGPCKLRVGSASSKKLEGAGKLLEEKSSGTSTRLRKTDNVRRMGGSLQARRETLPDARPDQAPAEVLAMLGDSAPTLQPPPRPGAAPSAPIPRTVTVGHSHLRSYMLPLVALQLENYSPLAWKGGQGPFEVSVSSQGEVLYQASGLEEREISPKELRLVPGTLYLLEVKGQGSAERLSHPFTVLLPSERHEFQAEVAELARAMGGTPRDLALARLAVAEDWGLWLEALESARAAEALDPNDAGVVAASGRALFNLGRFEEAEQTLRRARSLESPSR